MGTDAPGQRYEMPCDLAMMSVGDDSQPVVIHMGQQVVLAADYDRVVESQAQEIAALREALIQAIYYGS